MPLNSSEAEIDLGSFVPKISRDYDLSLVANIQVPLTIDGSTLYLKEATSDVVVTIYPSGRAVTLKKGQGENVGLYDSVRIVSAVNQSVTLALGHGKFQDNRFISSSSVTATIDPPNSMLTPGDNSILTVDEELVSASRVTKKQTILRNPVLNSAAFRIGPTPLDATKGVSLEPGEVIVIDGEQAIYAFNTHTASQSIEVAELDKV